MRSAVLAIALCIVVGEAALLSGNGRKPYLISLDHSKFGNAREVESFAENLTEQFGIGVSKIYHLNNAIFILVEENPSRINIIQKQTGVKYVQPDLIVEAVGFQTGKISGTNSQARKLVEAMDQSQVCAEQPAPECWGLDRIDQRDALPYTDPLNPEATYTHGGDHTGTTTHAYIADTGIDTNHSEFEGRAVHGHTSEGISGDDDVNGHGTHCAGIIGSRSYGVAKGVTLVAVKVLNDFGFGSTSGIIEGLEYIQNHHANRSEAGMAKSVMNLAIGGGPNEALDEAVESCISAGITVSVAAGGSNADACGFSPARVPDALTVSSTNVLDESAGFTNYGVCVDLFAPGVEIKSTQPDEGSSVFSGSASSSFVAGVVARIQDAAEVALTPQEVSDQLKSTATEDAIEFTEEEHATSPNLLLYAECDL